MPRFTVEATGWRVAPTSDQLPGLEKLERSEGDAIWDLANVDQAVEVDIYTQDMSFLITLSGVEAEDEVAAESWAENVLSSAGFEKIKVTAEAEKEERWRIRDCKF